MLWQRVASGIAATAGILHRKGMKCVQHFVASACRIFITGFQSVSKRPREQVPLMMSPDAQESAGVSVPVVFKRWRVFPSHSFTRESPLVMGCSDWNQFLHHLPLNNPFYRGS